MGTRRSAMSFRSAPPQRGPSRHPAVSLLLPSALLCLSTPPAGAQGTGGPPAPAHTHEVSIGAGTPQKLVVEGYHFIVPVQVRPLSAATAAVGNVSFSLIMRGVGGDGRVSPSDFGDLRVIRGASITNGVITFDNFPGDQTRSVDVAILIADDDVPEAEEMFTVSLGSLSGAGGFNPRKATRTSPFTSAIEANDNGVGISITGPAFVTEGTLAVFTVRHDNRLNRQGYFANISYTVSGSGPEDHAEPQDFSSLSPRSPLSVPLRRGEVRSISVLISPDREPERRETFTVTLTPTPGRNPRLTIILVRDSVTTTIRASDPTVNIGASGPTRVDDMGRVVSGGITEGQTVRIPLTVTPAGFPDPIEFRIIFFAKEPNVENPVDVKKDLGPLTYPSSSTVTPLGTPPTRRRDSAGYLLELPPGVTTSYVDMSTIDDSLVEDPESFIVLLLSDSPGGVQRGSNFSASVTIDDNDVVTVDIGSGAAGGIVSEGESIAFPLTFRGGVPMGDVVVSYRITGSAVDLHDFVGLSTSDMGGLSPPTPMIFTEERIREARIAGVPTTSILDLSVTTSGNAVDRDGDGKVEGRELFTVALDNVTTAVGSASLGTTTVAIGVIEDRDALTVAIASPRSPATAIEGESVSFPITITTDPDDAFVGTAVIIDYVISGASGSDITPGDFDDFVKDGDERRRQQRSSRLEAVRSKTLVPDQNNSSLTVLFHDDDLNERNEVFEVQLGSIRNQNGDILTTVVNQATASATIIDDDPLIVSIGTPTPATLAEGQTPSQSFRFPVSFASPGPTPTTVVTVSYRITGAAGADDLSTQEGGPALSSTTTLSAAFTPAAIRAADLALPALFVRDDDESEATEKFTMELMATAGSRDTPPVNVISGDLVAMGAASATITDDDPTTVTIGAPERARVMEGGSFRFPLSFQGELPTGNVTINYDISGTDGSDITADDFAPRGLTGQSKSVRLTGSRAVLIVETAEDDTEGEPAESFTVTLQPSPTVRLVFGETTAMGTIEDGLRIGILPVATSTVVEGAAFEFNIVASRAVSAAVSGTYSTATGTAGSMDFTEVSGAAFTIPAGETRATGGPFEVQTTDDSTIDDDTETFNVALAPLISPIPAGTTADDAAVTVTIRENDLRLTLSGPGVTVAEATPEQMATFTVRREGATSPAVTVGYEVSGVAAGNFRHSGGGVGDGDNPLRGSVTLGADVLSHTFTLTIIDDDDAEEVETLVVALLTGDVTGLPQGGTVVPPTTGSTQAAVTIAASDRIELVLERLTESGGTFVAAGGAVAEGGGTATYGVRLGPNADPLSQALTVSWSVCIVGECVEGVNSPAQAADFSAATTPPAGTVTIAVGQSTNPTFAVPVFQDDAVEGDERFVVQARATTAAGADVEAAPLTTAIIDDDARVAVSTDQAVVTEGDTATFTFTRSGVLDRAVTVHYRVAGADAPGVDADDFRIADPVPAVPANPSVVIPAGEASATLQIGIEPDGITGEPDETLRVTIGPVAFSSGTGAGTATGEGATAQITIIEGVRLSVVPEPPSTLSLPEGGVFRFRIVASREATAAEPIRGRYRTRAGTAGAGDFTPTPEGGTPFVIPAGEAQTGVFELQIADDTEVEADAESFTIELEATSPADAVVRAATVAIQENDLRLTLSGPGVTVAEATPEQMATFTVRREGATSPAVTVGYEVSGVAAGNFRHSGGGVGDGDNPLRGSVVLGADVLSHTFTLTIIDDDDAEEAETLVVALLTGDVTGLPQGGTVVPPTTGSTQAAVTIAASDRIELVLERLTESGGTFVAAGGAVAEGGGTATYGVRLGPNADPLSQALTVSWSVCIVGECVEGVNSPAQAADFSAATTPPAGTVTIAVGQSTNPTFAVPVFQDDAVEGDERFVVQARATTAAGADVEAAPLTTAIIDDDARVAVSTDQAVVTEGDTATFTFTRSGVLDRAVTVHYRVAGADAPGVDADDFRIADPVPAVPANPSVVIPAGEASTTLVIATEPDGITGEPDETLRVTIGPVAFSSGTGAGTATGEGATAQITIVEGIRLSVVPEPPSTLSLPEGGVFRFRIVASREATAAEPIRGRYRTRAGTAGAGDFTPTPEGGTPFVIPAGEAQTGVFELQIADDTEVEADAESFTIELEATSPADAVVRAATVAIQENDLRLTLSGPPEGQTEIAEASGGVATFTVARAGATSPAVTVGYEVSGVGIDDGDFDHPSPPAAGSDPLRGSVTLPAGTASTTFALSITDDAVAEGDEALQVRLVPGSVAGVAGEVELVAAADRPPRLTLVEDDVGIRVSTPSGTVGEGHTAVFTVTRRGDLGPEVALTYSMSGDGIDATDYEDLTDTEPLGRITLGAGQTSAEIRLRIVADGVSEPDEVLRVQVAEVRPPALSPGGWFELVMARAQVRIPRLEITVALSGPAEVSEGETAVFAVTLGLEPRRSVARSELRIGYTLGAPEVDTAQRGEDYTSSSDGQGTLRIPAGSSEGVIEVPVLRDGLLEAVEVFSLALAPGRSSGGGGSLRVDPEQRRLQVRILDNADQEARREQRTRAMVAATHRAAAQMATDVISNRFGHRNVRAQSPGDLEATNGTASLGVGVANRGSPAAKRGPTSRAQPGLCHNEPTARATCGPARAVSQRRTKSCSGRERTAEALARCGSARPHSAAERSHTVDVNAQQERTPGALRRAGTAPDARAPGSSPATNALSTALRLSGLPTGPTAATGAGTDAALQDPESAALLAGIDVPARPFETDPYTVGGSGAPSTDASATALGDALDPRLPSFAELLRGGHQFELSGEQAGLGGFGEGLSLWGAGTFQSLAGEPELDGRRLDYDGESFGVFLGADKRLALSGDGSELLAGAALGWTRGDLDYRDEALEVFELEGRFESKLWSIHPYASLRFSPRAQLWLIAGYGWGDAKIEERETREGERTATRRVETDATLWMVSAGAEGSVPLGSEASLLTARLQGTRTGGELDSARFGDGARLRGTRARTWRVAGELEVSHRFAFAEGGQFRPFATLRVRGDAGDDRQDDWEFAVDLGGGAELLWPEGGLSLGLEGTAQLNQLQEYQEHRVTVNLSYDLAGDGRGLTVAVGSTLEGSGRLGDRVDGRSGLSAGSVFATAPYAPGGASFGALLPGHAGSDYTAGRELGALRHSLQGEIGYGLAVLPFWRPGLLTPYVRFELAGRGSNAYATGLRFEAATGARLGMEMGVDFDRHRVTTPTRANSPDLQLLLTSELLF